MCNCGDDVAAAAAAAVIATAVVAAAAGVTGGDDRIGRDDGNSHDNDDDDDDDGRAVTAGVEATEGEMKHASEPSGTAAALVQMTWAAAVLTAALPLMA